VEIPLPDTSDPLDLAIETATLAVTGRDGEGRPTPTVRELAEILAALPERFQDLPVTRYCDEGIGGVDCELGYQSEERDHDPRMSKYTLHVTLW
jgi:hypothetical protein